MAFAKVFLQYAKAWACGSQDEEARCKAVWLWAMLAAMDRGTAKERVKTYYRFSFSEPEGVTQPAGCTVSAEVNGLIAFSNVPYQAPVADLIAQQLNAFFLAAGRIPALAYVDSDGELIIRAPDQWPSFSFMFSFSQCSGVTATLEQYCEGIEPYEPIDSPLMLQAWTEHTKFSAARQEFTLITNVT